ncbi:FRIGIDA-like protein 3 [Beta vulgaris subsp. vulgaris]|uniref:FRIGIDA-like protein 3 n=1 Tax=Beta vulgaris subsp. vulgaris TaxID=3555 RepID=UPI0025491F9B|nr:FRIGIDA-like protein 3 [Beta vulgaris subsp. vulgaris]
MSLTEQTSNDLKVASIIMHKLGATMKDFQSHSYSIFALNEQWRNLQNIFVTAHNSLENRVKEFESKEREFNINNNQIENIQKEVELKQKKLEFEEKSLSERIEQVEIREKQVKEWCEALELEKTAVIERCGAVEMKEKWFMAGFERIKAVDIEEKKVEERMRAVEEMQRMVEKREKEAKAVAEEMELREKGLKLKDDELSKLFLVLKEEKEVLELKKKELDELYNVVELKENEMKETMEIKEKEISKYRETMNEVSKEKKLKEIEVNEHCESKLNESYQLENLMEKRSDDSREKQSGSCSLTLVNRELVHSDISRVTYAVDSSSSKIGHDIHSLCKNMNTDGVRSYLINHVKEHYILQERVLDAIRFAPNPGKLVLDVCQSFHQNYPDKGEHVANNSCIFLLEQFSKLSAPITRDVEDDAIYFAGVLKNWLKNNCTPADNFGFLQFLAAFKLAGCYDADELLRVLGRLFGGSEVYRHEKQASLCRALGLSEKIPGMLIHLLYKLSLLIYSF